MSFQKLSTGPVVLLPSTSTLLARLPAMTSPVLSSSRSCTSAHASCTHAKIWSDCAAVDLEPAEEAGRALYSGGSALVVPSHKFETLRAKPSTVWRGVEPTLRRLKYLYTTRPQISLKPARVQGHDAVVLQSSRHTCALQITMLNSVAHHW